MDDNTTDTTANTNISPETTTTTPEPQPAQDEQGRYMTQAALDKIMGEVRRSEREKLERQFAERSSEPEAPKPKPQPSGRRGKGDTDAEVAQLRLENKFNRLMRGRELTGQQEDFLLNAFLAQAPDDPAGWMDSAIEAMGFNQATKEEKAEAPAVPAEPPASDGGVPTSTPPLDEIRDPTQLTRDTIERMTAKYGQREAQKRIRQMVERWGRNVQVTVG